MSRPTGSYTFEVESKRFGRFVITAPVSVRDEISAINWFMKRCDRRAVGRQFSVVAHRPGSGKPGKTLHLHRFIWEKLGHGTPEQIDHTTLEPRR